MPAGTMKVPLGLPHGAAWPVVAQVAALSQRPQGCIASADRMAETLLMARETVQRALAEAAAWIVAEPAGRRVRRRLAPIPEHAEWARISYRAAAGVGCHRVDGLWVARHNRSLLLELYARLRHAEDTGIRPTVAELAAALGVGRGTVQVALVALAQDGWISRIGRGLYRTYASRLRPVEALANVRAGSQVMYEPGHTSCTSQVTPEARTRSTNLKHDDLPLAVGDLRAVTGAGGAADAERANQPASEEGDGGAGDDPEGQAAVQECPAATAEHPGSEERGVVDALTPPVRQPRPPGSLGVMAAIPMGWQERMSAAERERLVEAIEAEMLAGRNAAQMSARIRRRLGHWRGVEVLRPIAAALTVVRRGYDCPRPECEDHLLPSGYECEACAVIGTEITKERRQAATGATQAGDHAASGQSSPFPAPRTPQGALSALAPSPPPAPVAMAAHRAPGPVAYTQDDTPGRAEIRALRREKGWVPGSRPTRLYKVKDSAPDRSTRARGDSGGPG